MSIADLASAVIGLRESASRDNLRLQAGLEELQAAVAATRSAVDESVDRRLAAAAQALRDLDRRLANDYERRYEALMTTLLEVTERLDTLATGADNTAEIDELRARLTSLSAPADRLRRILDDAGIRSFDPLGQIYDPLRHEVVQREFADDTEHEYVRAVVRPGYVREGLDHTLVRAKVIVAAPRVMEGKANG